MEKDDTKQSIRKINSAAVTKTNPRHRGDREEQIVGGKMLMSRGQEVQPPHRMPREELLFSEWN